MINTLQKAFEFSLEQRPWQILLDGDEMLIELRDMEQLNVSVAALNRHGDLTMKNLQLDWWHRLVGFDWNYFVFERIEDSMQPGACSLHAYPRKSGGQEHHLDKSRFVKLEDGILYFQSEAGHTEQLRLGSGAAPKVDLSIFYPEIFGSEHPDFEVLSSFIKEKIHRNPVHQIEYLDWNNMMLFSFYVLESKGFSNFIGVWGMQGEQLLLQILEPNVEKVAPESFFIWHDLLIFVSEKVKLNAYQLSV
jgi:hypothetical protein